MIFHTANKNVESLELMIDNIKIDRVHEFNFLGLTMNENLNWKSHINKIWNIVSKCIGIVNKLKYFLPLKTKVLLYTHWYSLIWILLYLFGAMNVSVL